MIQAPPKISHAHLRMLGFKQRHPNSLYFENKQDIFVYYLPNNKRWDWSLTSNPNHIEEAKALVNLLNNIDAKHAD